MLRHDSKHIYQSTQDTGEVSASLLYWPLRWTWTSLWSSLPHRDSLKPWEASESDTVNLYTFLHGHWWKAYLFEEISFEGKKIPTHNCNCSRFFFFNMKGCSFFLNNFSVKCVWLTHLYVYDAFSSAEYLFFLCIAFCLVFWLERGARTGFMSAVWITFKELQH